MSSRSQIVGLDLVRFVAALAVALHHLGACTWMLPPGNTIRDMANADIHLPSLAWTFHGWVGVQVFFVMSGVVIAYSAQKATAYRFGAGRIVRMMPALWVCATITAIFALLGGQQDVLKKYLGSMLFLPGTTFIDPSHWTLAIELAFYGVVLLSLAIGRRQWLVPLVTGIGVVSAACWVGSAAGLFGFTASRTSSLMLLTHGLYFALGVLMQDAFARKFNWGTICFILLFLVAAPLEIRQNSDVLQGRLIDPAWHHSSLAPILFWYGTMLAMAISLKFNRIMSRNEVVNGMLRKLGLATYPLYLINAIIGAYILGALVRFGFSAYAAFGLTLVACVLLALVFANRIEPLAQAVTRNALNAAWQRMAANKKAESPC